MNMTGEDFGHEVLGPITGEFCMRLCLRLAGYHAVVGNLVEVNAVAGAGTLDAGGIVTGCRFQSKT